MSLLDRLTSAERALLAPQPTPSWISPMLAVLSDDVCSGPDWFFERKLDGVRALALRTGPQLRLRSRNRGHLDASFPRLQRRIHRGDPDAARNTGIAVYYYVFDLLHLDGHDLRALPLRRRKALLRHLLDWEDPVRFTPHRIRDGGRLLEEACQRNWEGLIAKRAAGPYRSRRSSDWLKLKCAKGQELVIGGYTEPQGSRQELGALLVGYYDGDDLVYAGKVGTGFTAGVLRDLGARMRARGRTTPASWACVPTRRRPRWCARSREASAHDPAAARQRRAGPASTDALPVMATGADRPAEGSERQHDEAHDEQDQPDRPQDGHTEEESQDHQYHAYSDHGSVVPGRRYE